MDRILAQNTIYEDRVWLYYNCFTLSNYLAFRSSQSLLQAASSTTDQDLAPVDFSALDQIADASEAEGEGEEDDN
jgi:hypothetical protein